MLLGACLALVIQAPAQWLAQGVARASAGRMVLNNPQGTVWQGSAQWVLSDGQSRTSKTQSADVALPTRVHWQWRPTWHPTDGLALTLRLHAGCCTPEPLTLSIAPVWRGVSVRVADHLGQWPARWLVGLGAPWNTLQTEGQLQLSTQQLQLTVRSDAVHLSGHAQLDVMHLSTRLSTLRPLGNYRVVLSGGDTIGIKLDTLEGGLQLQGQGQWLNQRLLFKGEASAQPEFEAALSNLLNVLGQRQGAKSIMELS
jgi:general secretion pathway protein N